MSVGGSSGAAHGPAGRREGVHAAPALDASMSLLNEVVLRPVDPSYDEAAARGPRGGGPVRRAGRSTGHLLLGVVLGLVTTAAIVTLRTPQPDAVSGRELLDEQITERTELAEALQSSNRSISEEIAALQAEALSSADPAMVEALRQAEVASGAVAVSGPGLVVELDDPEGADDRDADPGSRVQDVDLQIVTNALWASGAEAVAINGQRLTALSAIRNAGSAVLVDLAPIVAPYRVEAVGDARAIQTGFARSAAAGHLALLSGTYGITSSVRAADELTLPDASTTTLRYAEVVPGTVADVASSPEPTTGGTP